MEVARDPSGEPGQRRRRPPRVYLEYLIDCPPCPRDQRGHLPLSAAAARRRRPGSPSAGDGPGSRRSLPATPTATAATQQPPDFAVHEDDLPPAVEFQRRTSPFRRVHGHDRVRRAASATPTTSSSADADPTTRAGLVRPRALTAEERGGCLGDAAGAVGPRQMSLQQMIRHRRSTSSSSNGSCTSLNVEPHQLQQQQQQQREQVLAI